jgi:hypothetical protein
VSTGHFRRTHGQSPRVLMVGAAESAPYASQSGCAATYSSARRRSFGVLTVIQTPS